MVEQQQTPPQFEILPPSDISMAHETIGWDIMQGLAIFSLFVLLIVMLVKYRKGKYRRNAVKKVRQIDVNSSNALISLFTVIKAVAIDVYGRDKVASLRGKELGEFFNKTAKKELLAVDAWMDYENAIYKSSQNVDDVKSFQNVCVKWIKRHDNRLVK